MGDEFFEEEVFPKVLANEVTCRLYLKELEKHGVTFSESIDELTHEECQSAAIRIYSTLKVEERTPGGQGR